MRRRGPMRRRMRCGPMRRRMRRRMRRGTPMRKRSEGLLGGMRWLLLHLLHLMGPRWRLPTLLARERARLEPRTSRGHCIVTPAGRAAPPPRPPSARARSSASGFSSRASVERMRLDVGAAEAVDHRVQPRRLLQHACPVNSRCRMRREPGQAAGGSARERKPPRAAAATAPKVAKPAPAPKPAPFEPQRTVQRRVPSLPTLRCLQDDRWRD